MAGVCVFGGVLSWEGAARRLVAFLLPFFAGLLMVSNIRYHSFKQFDLRGKVPFIVMVAMMLLFAVIYLHPPIVLFTGFLIYAVSGLILTLLQLQRRRAERKHEQQSSASKPEV